MDSEIRSYIPQDEQEASDQAIIMAHLNTYGHLAFTRAQGIAHLTSSSIILNANLTHMLMIHHNIYNTWTWTGGHADGETDLFEVALREAKEETGLDHLRPLSRSIMSLDILPVWGHYKRGQYVSAHLHLNTAYVFIADESSKLQVKPDENSDIAWIALEDVAERSQEPEIIKVYEKLIKRAKQLMASE